METEKLKELTKLSEKIDNLNKKIWHIDRLLYNCCGLNCKISGTEHAKFHSMPDYVSFSKEAIKNLLSYDLIKYKSELSDLNIELEKH